MRQLEDQERELKVKYLNMGQDYNDFVAKNKIVYSNMLKEAKLFKDIEFHNDTGGTHLPVISFCATLEADENNNFPYNTHISFRKYSIFFNETLDHIKQVTITAGIKDPIAFVHEVVPDLIEMGMDESYLRSEINTHLDAYKQYWDDLYNKTKSTHEQACEDFEKITKEYESKSREYYECKDYDKIKQE